MTEATELAVVGHHKSLMSSMADALVTVCLVGEATAKMLGATLVLFVGFDLVRPLAPWDEEPIRETFRTGIDQVLHIRFVDEAIELELYINKFFIYPFRHVTSDSVSIHTLAPQGNGLSGEYTTLEGPAIAAPWQ